MSVQRWRGFSDAVEFNRAKLQDVGGYGEASGALG
jgi:hypothetical protein